MGTHAEGGVRWNIVLGSRAWEPLFRCKSAAGTATISTSSTYSVLGVVASSSLRLVATCTSDLLGDPAAILDGSLDGHVGYRHIRRCPLVAVLDGQSNVVVRARERVRGTLAFVEPWGHS